jgi:KDO2-lipid IV(A) lauroyltransferase
MTRLVLLLMRVLHRLPVPLVRALGAGLGAVAYLAVARRRRVAQANIRACFPDYPAAEQSRLVRAVFRQFLQGVLDRAVLWHGSEARIRAFVTVAGEEHLTAHAGTPVIVLAPHFVGMEAGGTRLSMDRRMFSMYSNQKNAAFNQALIAGRSRFNAPLMLSRQDGVRRAVRELKSGRPFYYMPDLDFGPRDAVFVPFFGIAAATVTSVSRLARLTGAKVVPCIVSMTPTGYTATLHPAWDNYPGPSLEEDTRRMNAFIEAEARRIPAQYHWMHKRFKTRPPGEPSIYDGPPSAAGPDT